MLVFKKTNIKLPPQPLVAMFLGEDILQGEVYEAEDYQIIVHASRAGKMYVIRTKHSLGAFDALVHTRQDVEKYFKDDFFVRNHSKTHKPIQVDVSALP